MQRALATAEEVDRDRGRVVPPQLVRDTAEGGECFDQAVPDGLGALRRQGQGEGTIGVGPGHEQHRRLRAARGDIDLDVAEVRLGAVARGMVERDAGRAAVAAAGLHVAADLVGAAGVAVLLAGPAEQRAGGMPLLARGIRIGRRDGIDDFPGGAEGRGRPGLAEGVGHGFGVLQGLANRVAPGAAVLGELADTGAVAVCLPDGREVVHRTHPSSLPPAG